MSSSCSPHPYRRPAGFSGGCVATTSSSSLEKRYHTGIVNQTLGDTVCVSCPSSLWWCVSCIVKREETLNLSSKKGQAVVYKSVVSHGSVKNRQWRTCTSLYAVTSRVRAYPQTCGERGWSRNDSQWGVTPTGWKINKSCQSSTKTYSKYRTESTAKTRSVMPRTDRPS